MARNFEFDSDSDFGAGWSHAYLFVLVLYIDECTLRPAISTSEGEMCSCDDLLTC
jgi:hypothetical protein